MLGEGALAKLIGILSGSALALVFDPPRSRSGFARRIGASVIVGFVFGHICLQLLGWPETWENIIAAWCLASFGSWSIAGRLKSLIENYKKED